MNPGSRKPQRPLANGCASGTVHAHSHTRDAIGLDDLRKLPGRFDNFTAELERPSRRNHHGWFRLHVSLDKEGDAYRNLDDRPNG